jgi:hypothetical protein
MVEYTISLDGLSQSTIETSVAGLNVRKEVLYPFVVRGRCHYVLAAAADDVVWVVGKVKGGRVR